MTALYERFILSALSALQFHLLRFWRQWVGALIALAVLAGGYQWAFAAPASFSPGCIVIVSAGASAADVADELAAAHVIAHPAIFRAVLRLFGESDRIQAGAYRFDAPESAFSVAGRLATGDFGLPPVRITFPEGSTGRDMAALVAKALPEISANDFLSAAEPYEGYLFPDTYFFPPSATAASIVATMRENFRTKTAPLASAIAASGHPLSDIVTMASLVEKEARTPADKRIVAGILWHRIALGMPLQVDAVFGYIFGRDTYSPSYADLTVDSPYNTYTHKGLPPGPIDSPGLDSIEAAISPTKTNYLYYLTGTDGKMHYATTLAEHNRNRRLYLQ
ncbi:MAG TPA: endolytic transglycosylase MltG [Candidatus Paceibacterota bacterium]|nr:endolytic transglycosylase MltG [Candidatus Paceibacterota bacterium]